MPQDLTPEQRSRFNAILSGRPLGCRYILVQDNQTYGMEVIKTSNDPNELVADGARMIIIIDKEQMIVL